MFLTTRNALMAVGGIMMVTGFSPSSGWTVGQRHLQQHKKSATQLMFKRFASTHATTTPSDTGSMAWMLSRQVELSRLEVWCFSNMEAWYTRSLAIKCPFFRRRASDILDNVDMIMRFLVVRHKSLDLIPSPGCRCAAATCLKHKGLNIDEIATTVQRDWRQETHKGYYVTGRLNTTIYRDDCFFDGPDPDMPVRGLRKYLNAASQLFDYKSSFCELLQFEVVDDKTMTARWSMKGVLRLPWRPVLPEWTGKTTYKLDEDGLIYSHRETWDMSVAEAFLKTLLPEMAKYILEEEDEEEECNVPSG